MWCQMHFKVTIFLAFAFKITKVSPLPDRNTCKLPFCSNLKSWGGQLLAIELSTATRCLCLGGFQLPAVQPSTATRCHYQYQAEEAAILIGKLANCHSAQSSNWQSNPPDGHFWTFYSLVVWWYIYMKCTGM